MALHFASLNTFNAKLHYSSAIQECSKNEFNIPLKEKISLQKSYWIWITLRKRIVSRHYTNEVFINLFHFHIKNCLYSFQEVFNPSFNRTSEKVTAVDKYKYGFFHVFYLHSLPNWQKKITFPILIW